MNEKIIERLEAMKKRAEQIEDFLTSEEVIKDIKKLTALSKEQSQLQETVEEYNKFLKTVKDLDATKNIIENENDQELIELAKEESKSLEQTKKQIGENLKIMLLPKDPNDHKNVIVEIRGAAGGDEANIFASDLYRMYYRYSERQNWKFELLESTESEAGGFTHVAFMLKGNNVYSKMKFESGAHRVQRVPKTESKGRIHTSTATVVVLPEADDVDIEIKTVDLKIDTYRSSGAGGQHVNTTDSAVRITHIPTGIVVTSQDGRSQHDNKDKAMTVLKAKVYEEQVKKQQQEIGVIRKDAVGSGDRSEKIRTYNYPQSRVTDHRIGFNSQSLETIMDGNIDDMINGLINHDQKLKMEGHN